MVGEAGLPPDGRETMSADALAFDRHLDATAPAVADMARALRLAVLDEFPAAIEWFDPGNGLPAIGSARAMRDLYFAIIPHASHVNLQLADGAVLSDPDGRIEGTGKRIRHVKVRSVDEAGAAWLRRAIATQIAHRGADGAPGKRPDPGAPGTDTEERT